MKQILRLVIILLIVLLVLAIGGFVLLHSESFTEFAAQKWIEKRYSYVQIDRISIGKQFLRKKDRIIFRDVEIDAEIFDERYLLSFDQIVCSHLVQFLKSKRLLHVAFKNTDIESTRLNASQVNMEIFNHFEAAALDYMSGNLQGKSVTVGEYEFQNLKGHFEKQDDYLEIFDVVTKFYDGKLEGEMGVDFQEDKEYSVDLTVSEVQLEQLHKANPKVFSKLKGVVNGTVEFASTLKLITKTNISLIGAGGMSLRASLVKQLFGFLETTVPYLPKFDEFEDSEILLQNDEFIPFEVINLKLNRANDEELYAQMKLISRKYNLDLDLTSDIRVEAGLQSLLKYIFNE